MTTTALKMPEKAFLEFTVLEVGTTEDGKREVTGLALPYGEELERYDWTTGASRWVFAEGSAVLRETTQLFYGHDHLDRRTPIGLVVASEQTPGGLRITARISETAKGDEVYTLLKDGVLNRFSAGLIFTAYEITEADTGDPLLTLTEVDVFEVSVVPSPAFDSAVIDSVLDSERGGPPKERNTMPENQDEPVLATAEDVQTLAASITTLERQIATLPTTLGAPAPVPFASRGAFIQALAQGDADARTFYEQLLGKDEALLAYDGGDTGDLGGWLKDSWVGDKSRFVEANRTVLNLFGKSPLPASGNNVEFGVTGTDTTQVAEQAAEGDVLLKGKIAFDVDTAPVKTYGGWGEMSVQQILRSPVNVIERFYKALDRRYAQVTETVVRAKVQAAAGSHSIAATDLTTTDGWIDFIIECAVWLDVNKGIKPEFILLDKEAFKDLAKLRISAAPDAPYFLNRDSGKVNITGLSGEVFDLSVSLVPTFTADTVRVAHSDAIETYESAGAPFRLNDKDITNLTEAFSEYGFMAVAEEEPDCIIQPGV